MSNEQGEDLGKLTMVGMSQSNIRTDFPLIMDHWHHDRRRRGAAFI